jgi:hypothetical protein
MSSEVTQHLAQLFSLNAQRVSTARVKHKEKPRNGNPGLKVFH